MKQPLFIALFLSSLVTAAWADSRTVKLLLPSMNCAMCPITVRKALEKVEGVKRVSVDYQTKSALVVYDDNKTSVGQLTLATENAGYPSTEIRED